jgi:DMSO/TMAO reductase YedYZ molybdopterin-dependent catalytic subunit
MKRSLGFGIIICVFLWMSILGYAQESPASINIRGDILKTRQWAVADFKSQFGKEIKNLRFTSGEDKVEHTGTGVPLLLLLKAAGPKTEKVPKHHDLTFLVIVEALDHYRVFFSLAELQPSCGNARAFLIWNVDGKPLSAKEAPLRLVVLSDQGHDRYIYGIASITLVDGTKLANGFPDSR